MRNTPKDIPELLRDSDNKANVLVDNLFYKGPGGYPILEAEADFRTLCGHRLPTFPTEIIKVMVQIQTGQLLGGNFVINKFLQAQPTISHVSGIEDIFNQRISDLLRAINAKEGNNSAMRSELDSLQEIVGQIVAFRDHFCDY